MSERRPMYVVGELEMRSPWFSSDWVVRQGDEELAHVRRRHYTSIVDLARGGRAVIEPVDQGTVHALFDGTEAARITRESWVGRHWEITGPGFTYDLYSQPAPRRWRLTLANGTISEMRGGAGSYNKVRFDNQVAVPMSALLLAWHVVARPWEAVAEPTVLVPAF